MTHLVLLGDSIFDNAAYVDGGPAVIDHARMALDGSSQAHLLAVDGNVTIDVLKQMRSMPPTATHLALSVGGNDALVGLNRLSGRAESIMQGLKVLSEIQAQFASSYLTTLDGLISLGLPLMVCTIYDQVPGLTPELQTALSAFNDVIIRLAIQRRLPVLDLRQICNETSDYSAVSPIEPSAPGGMKIAKALVDALARHPFDHVVCQIYG